MLDEVDGWNNVVDYFKKIFGENIDINGMLYLIGIQELGHGMRTYSKEEKQDLMHVGLCKVLSYSGYYELEGLDHEGWPHWKKNKEIPALDLDDQEKLIKLNLVEYYKDELSK